MVLQLSGNEGKDEGQQSQQDVIGKDAADEDHGAFITLQDDLYILCRGVFDRVWREDDEPHCACDGLDDKVSKITLEQLTLLTLRGRSKEMHCV